MLWVSTAAFVVALFAVGTINQVETVHYASWRNWPGEPVESGFGSAFRSFFNLANMAVIPVALAAGATLGWVAITGRPRPLVAALAAAVACALAGEWTGFAGQDATRAEVQHLSVVSVVVTLLAFLVAPAVAAYAFATAGSRRSAEQLQSD